MRRLLGLAGGSARASAGCGSSGCRDVWARSSQLGLVPRGGALLTPRCAPYLAVVTCTLCPQVICLDNFFTGSKDNIAHLLDKVGAGGASGHVGCWPSARRGRRRRGEPAPTRSPASASASPAARQRPFARGDARQRPVARGLGAEPATTRCPHRCRSLHCFAALRATVPPQENFELIRHDVVEPILLEVDQIYHLACPASPVHYK